MDNTGSHALGDQETQLGWLHPPKLFTVPQSPFLGLMVSNTCVPQAPASYRWRSPLSDCTYASSWRVLYLGWGLKIPPTLQKLHWGRTWNNCSFQGPLGPPWQHPPNRGLGKLKDKGFGDTGSRVPRKSGAVGSGLHLWSHPSDLVCSRITPSTPKSCREGSSSVPGLWPTNLVVC